MKNLLLRLLPERVLGALKKIHYARTLDSLSPVDEADLRIVRALVRPGDRVLDVGANVGAITNALAGMVGPAGKVYSIEPIPATFNILCHCVRKRRLQNVEPIHCAVSDTDGVVTMEVPHYERGGENYYEARIVRGSDGSGLPRMQVAATTIDHVVETRVCGPVTFIKVDVEGHELSCLKGAEKTLRTFEPAWLIEISGEPDSEQSQSFELFRLMEQRGYAPYWSDGGRLQRRRRGDKSVNYFFFAAKHLRMMDNIGS